MSEQCRVCLETSSMEYFDMKTSKFVDITYLEFFLQCTQLKDDNVNILPVTICGYCSQELEIVYEFVNGARKADAILRKTTARPVENAAKPKEVNEDEEDVQENEMLVESLEPNEGDAEELKEEHVIEEFLDDDMEYEICNTLLDDSMLELGTDACSLDKMKIETLQDDSNDTKSSELIHLNINVEENNDDWEGAEVVYDIRLASSSSSDDDDFDATVIRAVRQATKWKCLICRRELRADISYEGHMNLHKKARPYKCAQCRTAFRCKNTLEHHINVHHQLSEELPEDYICLVCEKTFKQQQELTDHKCTEENSLTTCTECSKDFATNVVLEQHMQLVHSTAALVKCSHCTTLAPFERSALAEHFRLKHEQEFEQHFQADVEQFIVAEPIATRIESSSWQCDICRCILNTEVELQQHRSTHLKERPHECQYCAKCFAAAKNLREHVRSTHAVEHEQSLQESDMVVECETCKKQLLRRNLQRHMAMHEKKQLEAAQESSKFLCSFCPRECKNRKALHKHEKMHQGESPDVIYVCADCDRQYNTEHLLMQHRKLAHKKRDHICTICGNAFKLKNQLVNHMKLHLEKNIQCTYCDKKYARHFDLNVHMRTHTGELPYACHLCERRFAIKVRLTYHLQKHYGVKHQCKECGAEFNSKQKLKAHSYKHSGMPYRCEDCDHHGFANRDVFKRHLLRVHNTSMSNEALLDMFQRNTGKTTRIRTVDEINDDLMATQFLINADEVINLDLVETIVQS